MFRVKVALMVALLMAFATVGAIAYVTVALDHSITASVQETVERGERSLRHAARLEALELTTMVARLAREAELANVFAKPSENERRRAAYNAVEARQHVLEREFGRKAAIVAVLDKDGRVVARDLNPNVLYGDDLKARFPSIGMALAGTANKDTWNFEGQMYRAGAAPIRGANGQVLGALIVGYVQSNADAIAEEERIGAEVVYFFDGKIQASSFHDANRASEGSRFTAEETALAAQLFDGPKLAEGAFAERKVTAPFRVRLGGEEWIGTAGPLPGNSTSSMSGFVVLASLSAAKALRDPALIAVGLLGLLGLLAAVVAAVRTSRRFLVALDQVEAGVTEVINGNHDYVFESPSPDFEGLANGVNVMLARLLGRPEPGEEDDGEGGEGDDGARDRRGWQGDSLFVDETAAAAGGGAVAANQEALELAAESAEAYYERTWREYYAARQKTGEGVEGLRRDQFLEKLRQNEAALMRKYNARSIRFKVVVRGTQTTLKPFPVA